MYFGCIVGLTGRITSRQYLLVRSRQGELLDDWEEMIPISKKNFNQCSSRYQYIPCTVAGAYNTVGSMYSYCTVYTVSTVHNRQSLVASQYVRMYGRIDMYRYLGFEKVRGLNSSGLETPT